MRVKNACLSIVLILALPLLVVGCSKGGDVDTQPAQPAGSTADSRSDPSPTRTDRENVEEDRFHGDDMGEEDVDVTRINRGDLRDRLDTIYFGYDSYDLSSTSLATLQSNAEFLKTYTEHDVVVEGHCDERGTIEYNLALGEKRASAVREYLVGLGVDRNRVRIITFGEERPQDGGHDESAWSKNRRAAFDVE